MGIGGGRYSASADAVDIVTVPQIGLIIRERYYVEEEEHKESPEGFAWSGLLLLFVLAATGGFSLQETTEELEGWDNQPIIYGAARTTTCQRCECGAVVRSTTRTAGAVFVAPSSAAQRALGKRRGRLGRLGRRRGTGPGHKRKHRGTSPKTARKSPQTTKARHCTTAVATYAPAGSADRTSGPTAGGTQSPRPAYRP